KVTEQIDALRALASNPVKKLVVPKVLATTLMFPLLTIISCAVGISGGLVIATANLHLTANFYLRSVIDTVKYNDLASGIGKTFFFGFAIRPTAKPKKNLLPRVSASRFSSASRSS